MNSKCKNYCEEFDCCKVFSDFSDPMTSLQPCIESPCKYYKPKTNFDEIKTMGVEELSHELTKLFYKVAHFSNAEHYIKEWLQQEVDNA